MSSTTAEAVAMIRAGLDALLSVELSGLTRDEVAALSRDFEVQTRRVPSVQHRLVAQIDERALGHELGVRNTTGFLVTQLRLSPYEAAARIRAAGDRGPRRDLGGQPLPPIHAHLARAEADGLVSAGHVRVIAAALAELSPAADIAHGEQLERELVRDAAQFDSHHLKVIARHRLAHVDPDGVEPNEREQQRRRGIRHVVHADGSADWHLRLTAVSHAVWVTILDALSAPEPAQDGTRDPRTSSQRRHDGFLDAGLRLLRSADLPASGGVPVTILVTMSAKQLAEQTGYATTAHGDPINIPALLELAAEAEIIPTVLTGSGQVLHAGRARRLASPSMRLALFARDGGCCFPGCSMPIAWTEAHHVKPWAEGGSTDLNNLAPLCPYNHDQHEKQGWELVMRDGLPWWRPPTWIDPDRTLVRNTAHHHDPLVGVGPTISHLVDVEALGAGPLSAGPLSAGQVSAGQVSAGQVGAEALGAGPFGSEPCALPRAGAYAPGAS